jgi:hypothetical protein
MQDGGPILKDFTVSLTPSNATSKVFTIHLPYLAQCKALVNMIAGIYFNGVLCIFLSDNYYYFLDLGIRENESLPTNLTDRQLAILLEYCKHTKGQAVVWQDDAPERLDPITNEFDLAFLKMLNGVDEMIMTISVFF